MKTKNVIMPILAFVVAIGMAFATTPINAFQTEVWRENSNTPCQPSDCMIGTTDPCEAAFLYYGDKDCSEPVNAQKPH